MKRLLLVDGHNVLHAWGWLGMPDRTLARDHLIRELRIVHDVEGVDVVVVFDGRSPGRSVDPAVETDGFSVVYASAALTADGEIERRVAQDPHPERYTVVTNDGTIRGNVLAAHGEYLSPEDLRARIDRCVAKARRQVRSRQGASRGDFGNKLPL